MKIFLLLALLSAPAAAKIDYPVSVRVDYVFSLAQLSCYRLQTVGNTKVPGILRQVRNKFRLSDDELNLYLNYCMLYDQGYQRKGLRD